MKRIFRNSSAFWLFVLLGATVIFGCQCTSTSNPFEGWHFSFSQDLNKLDVSIKEDCQNYINQLPPKERQNMGPIHILGDDTGKHAVCLEIAVHGTDVTHALVYDKNNKRIKVIKYVSGHYRS